MLAKVCSAAVNGIEAYPVEVEVNAGYGDNPSGTPFRLWSSANAATPAQSWTVLTNGSFGADGTYSYTDGSPAAVQGFYRLSVP
jgi:hypothetical protein